MEKHICNQNTNFKVHTEMRSLSAQLTALGIHHMAKQCCEIIEKLKRYHNSVKDYNRESGSDHKTSGVSLRKASLSVACL